MRNDQSLPNPSPRSRGASAGRIAAPVAVVVAVVVAAVVAVVAGAGPAAAEDLNRVVLRVNDEIATLHDYEKRKSSEITRILSEPSLGADERQELLSRIGREVMNTIFNELLLVSFADQRGIRVTDREVDQAIRDMRESRGIPGRAELEQALAASGMTYDELRDGAFRDLLWGQVIGQEVNAKIDIGEEEVRAYYRNHPQEFEEPEKRHLREIIVLESSGLADDELRRLADDLHRRLSAGEDLETVAETHAEQEITTGVIDLGWLTADEIGDDLAEAAWALEPGQFSPPVAGRGGYHILHLAALEAAKALPFPEVQDRIMQRMRGRRFNQEMRAFMARAEEQSYIRENLPPEAVGYRALGDSFEPEDELEIFRSPTLPEAPPPAEADEANGR